MNMLDEIASEVGQLSDEDLAKAALEIQARNAAARDRAKQRQTPEAKAKMREREAKRRKTNAAILALAKQKGLIPAESTEAAPAAVTA
jgi:hypothetical protein